MNEQDILKYALEHGMINMPYVQEQVDMNKRKELLEKHPYKIWEGKDGKWRTYFPPGPYSKTAKNPVKSRDLRFFDNQIL